jgi:tetratricopeptide (TPR) repeat protein
MLVKCAPPCSRRAAEWELMEPRQILKLSLAQRRRRGFIIFGTRNRITNHGPAVTGVCPKCAQQTTLQNRAARAWFTLYFIPIFPVGAKRQFCQCQNCGTQFRLSAQELAQRTTVSRQTQVQQSIQMYNSLRASPANSVTLNNLMMLYFQLKEFDSAVSAANEFQQALNASEQCMTTLGRVLMEQGKHAEAIAWFDAGLARNDMMGEAAYCKAVSLMHLNPPDLAGATSAARIARSAGMNGAENLLREIETRSRATA